MSLHDEVERHFRAEARKAKKAGKPKQKYPIHSDFWEGEELNGFVPGTAQQEYEQELREIEELQEMKGIANKVRKMRKGK